ncbi:MAG: hypothetical protein IPL12_16375 [Bacteroidetes bacterium]|nr:hypothetical protein [Bacteroidota bacterium]
MNQKRKEDREKLEANVSAGAGFFSAEVNTAFSSMVASTKSTVSVQLYYEGGDVQVKPETIADLIKASNEWSKICRSKTKTVFCSIDVPWSITKRAATAK